MNDPYQAPRSETQKKPENWPVLASHGARLAGAIIDTLIVLMVILPIVAQMGIAEKYTEQSLDYYDALKITLLNGVAYLLLNAYLIKHYGQTIGKRIVGTRVVELKSKKIMRLNDYILRRFTPLLIINLVPVLSVFGPIIDALYIFNADRRCIHDHLAGSIVINA